jgi:Trk K+ transport system NAD-binding subunit
VGTFKDVQLAEFPVHNTPLAGHSLQESDLRAKTGVNVVGVWERGKLLPARPETLLSDSNVVLVVGSAEQVAALNTHVERFDTNDNPVIVIGGGKIGRAAAASLKAKGVPVHVVDRSPAAAERCASLADRVFVGESSDRETLMAAGIERAPSVVLTTNDDATNIYLCIYCRRLNPHVRIVSRITHERNVEAIHRAGADFALSYATLGQEAVLAFLLGRDLIFVGERVRFFSLKTPASLVGKTLGESEIGTLTGLNVVAIHEDGKTIVNPPPDRVLSTADELYALGSPEQRRQYQQLFMG